MINVTDNPIPSFWKLFALDSPNECFMLPFTFTELS